jgi:superfamily I DNA/RNA helicase
MLGRRGRYASWTVVGDPAQSAWTGDPAELTRARDAALRLSSTPPPHPGLSSTPPPHPGLSSTPPPHPGLSSTPPPHPRSRRWSEHTLTTNYRNSAEIFARAAGVIREVSPDIELPTAVRATGVPPVEREVPAGGLPDAVRAAAEELLDQVEGTVGVITPVGRREEMAPWVDHLDLARLQVVSSLEAKGMEYDGVVLVEPGEIRGDSESGVRTLYVALSRATQRLTILSSR